MEEGRGLPTKEAEPQKRAKVARIGQTRSSSEGSIVDRGRDRSFNIQSWNPPFVLNGSPLLSNASIRDFQQGRAGFVTNAVD